MTTIGPTGVIRTQTGFADTAQIGPGHSFGGNMTLVNQGLISSQVSGRNITVNPVVFDNQGVVEVLDGGSVTLGGSIQNHGTINVRSGTLTITGAYAHHADAVLKGSGTVQIGTFVNGGAEIGRASCRERVL